MAICEGYATGASIYESTNIGVIVAFDAGNLSPSPEPGASSSPISGSSCARTMTSGLRADQNPGLTRAKEAVAAIGAPACGVKPTFKSLEGRPTDFNDMASRDGRDAVKARILAAIKADIRRRPRPQCPRRPRQLPHHSGPPSGA